MRYTISTPVSLQGVQWHLAHIESYTAAVKMLPMLSDIHDCEAQLWERDTIRARYMNGKVHFEPGADIPSGTDYTINK